MHSEFRYTASKHIASLAGSRSRGSDERQFLAAPSQSIMKRSAGGREKNKKKDEEEDRSRAEDAERTLEEPSHRYPVITHTPADRLPHLIALMK